MVTDDRLPQADNQAAAQTSQAGPETDSGPAAHVGNGSLTGGAERRIPSDALGEITLRFIEELVGSMTRLAEIYADRMQLAVRRSVVRIALGVMAVVCIAIWLGAAALTTLRGLCAGIAELSGRAWLGDLAGGSLALVFAAGVVAFGYRIASRRELRRLEAKYERSASKRAHGGADAPADDAA